MKIGRSLISVPITLKACWAVFFCHLLFPLFPLSPFTMSFNPPQVFPDALTDRTLVDNPPGDKTADPVLLNKSPDKTNIVDSEDYSTATDDDASTGTDESFDTTPETSSQSIVDNSERMDVDPIVPPDVAKTDLDLLSSVKGMFRVLDLISESGSGGLVDKIIIAQESLKEFINALCPGAYASLIKVDFKALDNLNIKPLGLYGSKSEIISFLSCRGAIDDETARALRLSKDNTSDPQLRSGLYVLRSPEPVVPEEIFVIYWPEATTWNDDAISSVRRNRVTFMRYLTKITDQVTCLISPEHARAIVWNDEAEDIPMDIDEESDRLFTFEVAKTNEQDENVVVRPGFTMNTPILSIEKLHDECTLDASEFQPSLIRGETTQAILTRHFVPGRFTERFIRGESCNAVQLKNLIENGSIRLGPKLTDEAILILMEHGLQSRFPGPFKAWKSRNDTAKKSIDVVCKEEERETAKKLNEDSPKQGPMLREAIIDRLLVLFPTVQRTVLSSSSAEDIASLRGQYESFVMLHPQLKDEVARSTSGDKPNNTKLSPKFRTLKERLICIETILKEKDDLGDAERAELIEHVSEKGLDDLSLPLKDKGSAAEGKGIVNKVWSWFSDEQPSAVERKIRQRVREQLAASTDGRFLAHLDEMLANEPLLQNILAQAAEAAHDDLQRVVQKLVEALIGRALLIQKDNLKGQIQRKAAGQLEDHYKSSRLQLIEEYEREIPSGSCVLTLDNVERSKSVYAGSPFKITGHIKDRTEPKIECRIHVMYLTTEDQHTLQLDPAFVPQPRVQACSAQIFHLPLGHRILHAQSIEHGKHLVVIEDADHFLIFLETSSALDNAISRGRSSAKRVLHRDKIGSDIVLAYDEQKRMLSLCASSKLVLHIYVFDENFSSLQAWGSSLDLKPWYTQGTFVSQSCFVSGSEELLFIDTSRQARVFSLITQQFRPASLLLEQLPDAVYSSPDAACLLVSFRDHEGLSFRAYHWDTFGSSQGIDLGIIDLPDGPTALTSLVNRRSVHLFGISTSSHTCKSVALDITKKTTEFMFKETGVKNVSNSSSMATAHNCLIDCHADVWTRFPVVAAVQRKTIVSSVNRMARKLVFVTDHDHDRFSGHWADLIYSFEQRTRKPTGDALKSIQVLALQSEASFFSEASLDHQWDISQFRAGEWLVDLLCLIPIQIAVTRENRFLPLKDGVASAALERSLLGAEVGQIVDALSLGWYESVFQSYMTSKPVKVVSSMGEQSVGKSFSLNHLADTSFAGSAMRTTEGVWMAVTPTDDSLVVALDFEGVHSIERSAQEDTLLVLFNTAVSNLVLFRNNFAMSRSITGLFQSFQSSSTVLDPAANPTLFRSTLTIIIKDVVESDKKEIVREFSTKFQKIVEDEQDANFISRLHAGQLNIVPWPVIESKQFYQLFPAMKRLLDKQEVTHQTAGEFLYTLKTLMAKLKANDWGSLSQTLVAHRAHKLLGGLANALAFGLYEVEPDNEPLKNFDTDNLIEKPGTSEQFFLSSAEAPPARREAMLMKLQNTWSQLDQRPHVAEAEWTEELSAYLEGLADLRIQHVWEWISSNLSRFKSSHANIDLLRRVYDSTVVDLRSNVEICRAQCASCQLKCLLSRRHDSTTSHDCRTSHQCPHSCDFGDEHPTVEKMCGLPAGHAGRHICAVDIHLCGEPCGLKDKQGCLGSCMKVVGHTEEDHMCSARLHKCGEPCDLKNLRLPSNERYSCSRTCAISSDEAHTQHVCDASACPIACELCKRLCSDSDHLHGLQADAVHLCGQAHNCAALCQASGTCEIETAPQSIEATFTGRHETFQYTKYSQVAKRLPCVFPIPPGERQHSGPHNHSADPAPFHFCEERCESCGYYCTLPRGHPQQEHETHHGSMSRTRWAVDGPDGTILELNGRKFGSDDDGAPMMCNLVCQEMGRHVHVDYCRADSAASCDGPEFQHITTRLTPNPARAKDWITHSLFWRRTGFKGKSLPCKLQWYKICLCTKPDPYSRPDQVNFAKWIFVIDRSGSMGGRDRLPLQNAPATVLITRHANNRLGAVFSALHGFWMSRNTALNSGGQRAAPPARRDAYSVILFDHTLSTCVANDFTSSPDELLNKLLQYRDGGGTNFTAAIQSAEAIMRQHWSTERSPVVVFLSDGECDIADETVRSLSRAAVSLGKPLSFHSVSFGSAAQSLVLRRMAQVALEVQTNAPRDPLTPAEAVINSSYSEALDTVRLAETFLGFAESLRKPRGALFSLKQS
ncbi:hypothetical protein B0H10DRAFT_2188402 [Mycena sp. CBHHK59/15]|nr:hypothetical protein B0H10DRAFT_2188402 [Mycena sp. CBHHK59/15]